MEFHDPHEKLKKAFFKTVSKTKAYYQLKSIQDLLRAYFLKRVAGSAVISREDQDARVAYDSAVAAFDEARLAMGMTISLRKEIANEAAALSKMRLDDFAFIMPMKTKYCERARELMLELKIPSGDEEQAEWAIENIRSAQRLIAEDKFALLGAAQGIANEYPKSASVGGSSA